MAHFAEIGTNNQVIRVIVVNNDVLLDENGVEQEQLGKDFCTSLLGGNWVQTSYNGNFRKKYAAALYDPIADVFYDSQPYPSWTLDANHDWQPPTPKPEGMYSWNEEKLEWVAI